MSRSLKKGPYCDPKLLQKINRLPSGAKQAIKTWSRQSTIYPEMVGCIFAVHNGRKFIDVSVIEEMVGHRLGEFAPTRTFKHHGGKMAKEQAQAESAPKTPEKK